MMNENITFDDNQYKIKSRSILSQSESPAMIQLLVKRGVVKNERQALGVMFAIIFLLIGSSVYMIYSSFYRQPDVVHSALEEQLLLNPGLNIKE